MQAAVEDFAWGPIDPRGAGAPSQHRAGKCFPDRLRLPRKLGPATMKVVIEEGRHAAWQLGGRGPDVPPAGPEVADPRHA
eukprot:15472670-Alexandrium_andersonii.AAC.1